MARILITGMSGAGKSTLLRTLAERGYLTVDTDYDGWTLAGGRWDAARMSSLLSREADVVVAGTVDNQGDFYDCFDRVVLLSAPLDILIERVSSRTTNPYGRTVAEQAEIAHYVQTVEPLLRKTAAVELDGQASVSDLAGAVEELIERHARGQEASGPLAFDAAHPQTMSDSEAELPAPVSHVVGLQCQASTGTGHMANRLRCRIEPYRPSGTAGLTGSRHASPRSR